MSSLTNFQKDKQVLFEKWPIMAKKWPTMAKNLPKDLYCPKMATFLGGVCFLNLFTPQRHLPLWGGSS